MKLFNGKTTNSSKNIKESSIKNQIPSVRRLIPCNLFEDLDKEHEKSLNKCKTPKSSPKAINVTTIEPKQQINVNCADKVNSPKISSSKTKDKFSISKCKTKCDTTTTSSTKKQPKPILEEIPEQKDHKRRKIYERRKSLYDVDRQAKKRKVVERRHSTHDEVSDISSSQKVPTILENRCALYPDIELTKDKFSKCDTTTTSSTKKQPKPILEETEQKDHKRRKISERRKSLYDMDRQSKTRKVVERRHSTHGEVSDISSSQKVPTILENRCALYPDIELSYSPVYEEPPETEAFVQTKPPEEHGAPLHILKRKLSCQDDWDSASAFVAQCKLRKITRRRQTYHSEVSDFFPIATKKQRSNSFLKADLSFSEPNDDEIINAFANTKNDSEEEDDSPYMTLGDLIKLYEEKTVENKIVVKKEIIIISSDDDSDIEKGDEMHLYISPDEDNNEDVQNCQKKISPDKTINKTSICDSVETNFREQNNNKTPPTEAEKEEKCIKKEKHSVEIQDPKENLCSEKKSSDQIDCKNKSNNKDIIHQNSNEKKKEVSQEKLSSPKHSLKLSDSSSKKSHKSSPRSSHHQNSLSKKKSASNEKLFTPKKIIENTPKELENPTSKKTQQKEKLSSSKKSTDKSKPKLKSTEQDRSEKRKEDNPDHQKSKTDKSRHAKDDKVKSKTVLKKSSSSNTKSTPADVSKTSSDCATGKKLTKTPVDKATKKSSRSDAKYNQKDCVEKIKEHNSASKTSDIIVKKSTCLSDKSANKDSKQEKNEENSDSNATSNNKNKCGRETISSTPKTAIKTPITDKSIKKSSSESKSSAEKSPTRMETKETPASKTSERIESPSTPKKIINTSETLNTVNSTEEHLQDKEKEADPVLQTVEHQNTNAKNDCTQEITFSTPKKSTKTLEVDKDLNENIKQENLTSNISEVVDKLPVILAHQDCKEIQQESDSDLALQCSIKTLDNIVKISSSEFAESDLQEKQNDTCVISDDKPMQTKCLEKNETTNKSLKSSEQICSILKQEETVATPKIPRYTFKTEEALKKLQNSIDKSFDQNVNAMKVDAFPVDDSDKKEKNAKEDLSNISIEQSEKSSPNSSINLNDVIKSDEGTMLQLQTKSFKTTWQPKCGVQDGKRRIVSYIDDAVYKDIFPKLKLDIPVIIDLKKEENKRIRRESIDAYLQMVEPKDIEKIIDLEKGDQLLKTKSVKTNETLAKDIPNQQSSSVTLMNHDIYRKRSCSSNCTPKEIESKKLKYTASEVDNNNEDESSKISENSASSPKTEEIESKKLKLTASEVSNNNKDESCKIFENSASSPKTEDIESKKHTASEVRNNNEDKSCKISENSVSSPKTEEIESKKKITASEVSNNNKNESCKISENSASSLMKTEEIESKKKITVSEVSNNNKNESCKLSENSASSLKTEEIESKKKNTASEVSNNNKNESCKISENSESSLKTEEIGSKKKITASKVSNNNKNESCKISENSASSPKTQEIESKKKITASEVSNNNKNESFKISENSASSLKTKSLKPEPLLNKSIPTHSLLSTNKQTHLKEDGISISSDKSVNKKSVPTAITVENIDILFPSVTYNDDNINHSRDNNITLHRMDKGLNRMSRISTDSAIDLEDDLMLLERPNSKKLAPIKPIKNIINCKTDTAVDHLASYFVSLFYIYLKYYESAKKENFVVSEKVNYYDRYRIYHLHNLYERIKTIRVSYLKKKQFFKNMVRTLKALGGQIIELNDRTVIKFMEHVLSLLRNNFPLPRESRILLNLLQLPITTMYMAQLIRGVKTNYPNRKLVECMLDFPERFNLALIEIEGIVEDVSTTAEDSSLAEAQNIKSDNLPSCSWFPTKYTRLPNKSSTIISKENTREQITTVPIATERIITEQITTERIITEQIITEPISTEHVTTYPCIPKKRPILQTNVLSPSTAISPSIAQPNKPSTSYPPKKRPIPTQPSTSIDTEHTNPEPESLPDLLSTINQTKSYLNYYQPMNERKCQHAVQRTSATSYNIILLPPSDVVTPIKTTMENKVSAVAENASNLAQRKCIANNEAPDNINSTNVITHINQVQESLPKGSVIHQIEELQTNNPVNVNLDSQVGSKLQTLNAVAITKLSYGNFLEKGILPDHSPVRTQLHRTQLISSTNTEEHAKCIHNTHQIQSTNITSPLSQILVNKSLSKEGNSATFQDQFIQTMQKKIIYPFQESTLDENPPSSSKALPLTSVAAYQSKQNLQISQIAPKDASRQHQYSTLEHNPQSSPKPLPFSQTSKQNLPISENPQFQESTLDQNSQLNRSQNLSFQHIISPKRSRSVPGAKSSQLTLPEVVQPTNSVLPASRTSIPVSENCPQSCQLQVMDRNVQSRIIDHPSIQALVGPYQSKQNSLYTSEKHQSSLQSSNLPQSSESMPQSKANVDLDSKSLAEVSKIFHESRQHVQNSWRDMKNTATSSSKTSVSQSRKINRREHCVNLASVRDNYGKIWNRDLQANNTSLPKPESSSQTKPVQKKNVNDTQNQQAQIELNIYQKQPGEIIHNGENSNKIQSLAFGLSQPIQNNAVSTKQQYQHLQQTPTTINTSVTRAVLSNSVYNKPASSISFTSTASSDFNSPQVTNHIATRPAAIPFYSTPSQAQQLHRESSFQTITTTASPCSTSQLTTNSNPSPVIPSSSRHISSQVNASSNYHQPAVEAIPVINSLQTTKRNKRRPSLAAKAISPNQQPQQQQQLLQNNCPNYHSPNPYYYPSNYKMYGPYTGNENYQTNAQNHTYEQLNYQQRILYEQMQQQLFHSTGSSRYNAFYNNPAAPKYPPPYPGTSYTNQAVPNYDNWQVSSQNMTANIPNSTKNVSAESSGVLPQVQGPINNNYNTLQVAPAIISGNKPNIEARSLPPYTTVIETTERISHTHIINQDRIVQPNRLISENVQNLQEQSNIVHLDQNNPVHQQTISQHNRLVLQSRPDNNRNQQVFRERQQAISQPDQLEFQRMSNLENHHNQQEQSNIVLRGQNSHPQRQYNEMAIQSRHANHKSPQIQPGQSNIIFQNQNNQNNQLAHRLEHIEHAIQQIHADKRQIMGQDAQWFYRDAMSHPHNQVSLHAINDRLVSSGRSLDLENQQNILSQKNDQMKLQSTTNVRSSAPLLRQAIVNNQVIAQQQTLNPVFNVHQPVTENMSQQPFDYMRHSYKAQYLKCKQMEMADRISRNSNENKLIPLSTSAEQLKCSTSNTTNNRVVSVPHNVENQNSPQELLDNNNCYGQPMRELAELMKARGEIEVTPEVQEINLPEFISINDLPSTILTKNCSIHPSNNKVCEICGAPAPSQCSACEKVAYCSEACQLKDWDTHQLKCTMPNERNNNA